METMGGRLDEMIRSDDDDDDDDDGDKYDYGCTITLLQLQSFLATKCIHYRKGQDVRGSRRRRNTLEWIISMPRREEASETLDRRAFRPEKQTFSQIISNQSITE
jgi:hypothetical protein